MDGNEDYFLALLGVLLTAFVLTGGILGWIAFFQVRKLRQEWATRLDAPALPVTAPVPAPRSAEPPPAPRAEPADAGPQPPAVAAPPAAHVNLPPGQKTNRPPRVAPDWERRLLENWTGLVGLAVVLLGLGFLAVYGAAVLNPFGRFLLIVAAAAASMAGGMALVKYQPRWTRWGYWLQSFGAAVFLVGCLGSGGIPGVAWVTNPLAGLGLLLLGVSANLALGWHRRRQPHLTLHVALSLVALAVAEPVPLIILALWATAFLGLALSWFQKWAYHRAVTIAVVQGILTAAYWRAAPDPSLQWLVLGASASLALLVHIASYRRVDAEWSRPTFVTHVLNALAAAVPCALWSPKLPMATAAVLIVVFAALVLLSLRSRGAGTTWLYRTDRVLALAVAGIVLLLNPLNNPAVVLGSLFVLLAAALAWSARAEGDGLLARVGLGLMTVGLGALAVVSVFYYYYRGDTDEWLWQTGAVLLAAAAAGAFSATAKESSEWHTALEAVLPPAFFLPLTVLWMGAGSPVPGLSPGWIFAVPAGALALLARLGGRQVLAWSLMATAAFAVLGNWSSWLGQGRLWGSWLPTLIWGAGATIPAVLTVFASPTRTSRFLASCLFALGSTALLVWLTLEPIHPAYSMLGLSALFLVVLLLDLERFHVGLASSSALVLTVALAVARLAWAVQAPVGWIALGCDAVVAGLLAAAALNRRTGQSVFCEACLVWLVWAIWFDLPGDTLGLGLAVLAVVALVAGRALRRPRLDWYSAIAFLLAAVACLVFDVAWIKATTLAVLVVYLVLDSVWKSEDEPGWQPGLRPIRRYVLVFAQALVLALSLPDFLDSRVLTFGWSLEAALVFFLAVVWKDEIFKNTALAGLGICLVRLIWVDLSTSDVLTKAITFLSVGGLMVGMNVLYLWSKNRRDKPQP